MTDTMAGEAGDRLRNIFSRHAGRAADSTAFTLAKPDHSPDEFWDMVAFDFLAAQPSAGAQEEGPTRGDLCRDAKAALDRLIDWCDFNEVQWDACCDDGVPAVAETWTINAKAAKALLEDDAPRYATPAQPDTGDVSLLHPATADLIDRFAVALKHKLAKAEVKYGYSDGWLNVGWQADLASKLAEHVQKGDPRDVAAYCAFAWHHGWLTTPSDTNTDTGDVAALRGMLVLILPMAKGYASANRVGSNADYIQAADDLLAATQLKAHGGEQ